MKGRLVAALVMGVLAAAGAPAFAQEESSGAGKDVTLPSLPEVSAQEASAASEQAAPSPSQAAAGQAAQAQQQQAQQQQQSQVSGGAGVPDPFNLDSELSAPPADLPPFAQLNQAAGFVAPGLQQRQETGLALDIDARIKQTEDVVARMVWQINRETAWANSVRDIIQNYQYKYSKVLSSIKQHSASTAKMRDMLSQLKKARLHEVLESDLNKAGRELTELAASSADTNEDDNSYASLKDRVVLMKQDLEKMSHAKVNKVLHGVQDQLKVAAQEAIPKPSSDTLKSLIDA